jgi:hypothetical protein
MRRVSGTCSLIRQFDELSGSRPCVASPRTLLEPFELQIRGNEAGDVEDLVAVEIL